MRAESSEPPDLDDLRRRLYAPDASQEDVARYTAARGDSDAPITGPEPTAGRRRSWTVGAIVVATVVVVALAAGLVGAERRPVARPPATAFASPSIPALIEVGIPAPVPVRNTFVRELGSGADAGILDYLYRHPDLLPAQLRTVQRAASSEYRGRGPASVVLDPSVLAERGGRATVILVLARTGDFAWQATRANRLVDDETVAALRGDSQAGAPVAATFRYGRGAPSRLSVVVPVGTRWGAVVVFTD